MITLHYKDNSYSSIPKIILNKSPEKLSQMISYILDNLPKSTQNQLLLKHNLTFKEFKEKILLSKNSKFLCLFQKMLNSGFFDKFYTSEGIFVKKLARSEYNFEINRNKKHALKLKESKSGLVLGYHLIDLDEKDNLNCISDSTYDSCYEDSDPESCDLEGADQSTRINNLIHKHKVSVQNSIPCKTSMILSKVKIFIFFFLHPN